MRAINAIYIPLTNFSTLAARRAVPDTSWISSVQDPLCAKLRSTVTSSLQQKLWGARKTLWKAKEWKKRCPRISRKLCCFCSICTKTLIMPLKLSFLSGKMKKYICQPQGKIVRINLHLLLLVSMSVSSRNVSHVVKVSICQTHLRFSLLLPFYNLTDIFNQEIIH